MGRFAKMLWIWMLILVLPVQAVASANSLSCGPWHHAAASIAKNQRAAYSANKKVTVTLAGHDVGIGADKVALQPGQSRDTSPSQDVRSSACAMCCISASVLPTRNSWRPAIGHEAAFGAHPITLFTSYIPARLERPPRSS